MGYIVFEAKSMDNCSCSVKTKKRSEEEKKILITRMNRLIGQMNGVKKIIYVLLEYHILNMII